MNPAVLKNLSYGMYVIGTKYNGRPNACVANSVIQISSSDPEKVLIALTKDTHSCTAIRENGIFTISVLSTDTPASVIGALGLVSGKNADKLKNIRHKVLIEGVPVVKENTCCWFLCKVISGMDVGQEMVFAAAVKCTVCRRSARRPMCRRKARLIRAAVKALSAPCAAMCTATRTSALKNCRTTGCARSAKCRKRHSCAEIK